MSVLLWLGYAFGCAWSAAFIQATDKGRRTRSAVMGNALAAMFWPGLLVFAFAIEFFNAAVGGRGR